MIDFISWVTSIFTQFFGTIGSVTDFLVTNLESMNTKLVEYQFATDSPVLHFMGTCRYLLGDSLYFLLISLILFSSCFVVIGLINAFLSWLIDLRKAILG